MNALEALRQDARYAHRLRHGDTPPTIFTRGRILFSRGLLILAVHRITRAMSLHPPSGPAGRWARPPLWIAAQMARFVVAIVAKTQVAGLTDFEEGVRISDRGHVVMGAHRVGAGTLIHHDVTIGVHPVGRGIPTIGHRVWIGPGSIIYGNLHIGDGVTILPGTVLSKNVPANTVVAGNPARIVRRDFDNRRLFESLATEVDHVVVDGPAPQ